MSEKIKYLYENKDIAQILSSGFARICEEKPKFPINYLARFLKNHTQKQSQRTKMIDRIENNQNILTDLEKTLEAEQLKRLELQEKLKVQRMDQDHFVSRIEEADRHEEHLDHFCQWISEKYQLSAVYIGQLVNQTKKIDTLTEDSESAHLELEKEKVVKFRFASEAQKNVIVGRQLPLQSVVGKLITESGSQDNNAEAQEEPQDGEKKVSQVKGEVYFDSVVGNQELKFFRFPKLGSYFAVALTVKSYLNEKLFDENTVKVENYTKVKQEFEKQMSEKEVKFREAYEQKQNSGAQEKQLQEFEKEYEKQRSQTKPPTVEEFQFIEKKFVICMDTLGLDKQIDSQKKQSLGAMINLLKDSWQKAQKGQLEADIKKQIELISPIIEEGSEKQVPNYPEQLNNLIEEQEKDLPSNEQVDRVKDNEKLMELQMNTLRVEKVKEYLADEKNLNLWDHLLDLNVIKYPAIIKQLLIFLGYKKDQFCFKSTNVLDWEKTKIILNQDKVKIFETIAGTNVRGSKPEYILKYANCSRILQNLQGLEPATVSSYNLYLAFLLRFLQLYCKTRVQDREARVQNIQSEREAREAKIKQTQQKEVEKNQKLETLKQEAEQKGEPLDEEAIAAWILQYDEENPPPLIPDEIPDDIDRDLDDFEGQGQKQEEGNEAEAGE